MKKLQDQLKEVSATLAKLSKQVQRITVQVKKFDQPKKAVKTAAPKKKAAAKAAPAKKAAKKAAPKAAPKAAAKATAKAATVLDTVLDVIKKSRQGASIAILKEKTNLNPRQLSNALYKLSKREKIVAKARGLYVKK